MTQLLYKILFAFVLGVFFTAPAMGSDINFQPIPMVIDTNDVDHIKATAVKKSNQLQTKFKGHHYKILVESTREEDKMYLSLSEFGHINSQMIRKGIYGQFLGPIMDKEKAEQKLEMVRNRGFENAILLEFNDGYLVSIHQEEEIEEVAEELEEVETFIEEIFKSKNVSYHILFRVLDNPYEQFEDLESLGPLYRETFDEEGNSRYLVGNTTNPLEAKALLQKVKDKGYKTSFIVEYLNGEINEVIGDGEGLEDEY